MGEDQGHPFIAFEFVEGQNLRDLVAQRGLLSVATALNFTVQIAEALAHASRRDVVHRDIKPSNVLITPEGHAKLADMGLARLHQIERSGEDLTASGVTLGTFDYISPEQARDPRNADARSDIYSLGCTLFFMLTGRPPFPDGTVLQKLLQHQADEAPDPRDFNPDVPPPVSRLLRKMMAKEPRQRQQSPEELVSDLVALAHELGLEVTNPENLLLASNPPLQPSWSERHLVWMVPVAALVVIFVVLELSSWHQSRTAATPTTLEKATSATPGLRQDALPSTDRSPISKSNDSGDRPRPSAVIRASRPAAAEPTAATNAQAETRNAFRDSDAGPFQVGPDNPIAATLNRLESSEKTKAGASAAADVSAAATVDGASSAKLSGTSSTAAPQSATKSLRQSGIRVVVPGADAEGVYASLQAAFAAAESGDVIELQFDGPQEEKPIDLRNQRITVRAGEGFTPIVFFRPNETDPVKFPRNMLNVSGGQLTLVNLAIELELPREMPADSWSLIRLQQAEAMQLEHCSLTIHNTAEHGRGYHQDVAFIRVAGAPGSGAMMGTEDIGVAPLSLQLRDCVARGEGTFLVHTDVQPCTLSWSNGLLATTDRLLHSEGGRKAVCSADQLVLDLRHLTADVRSGMCLLTNTVDAPYQLTTEIRLTNSIVLGTPTSAMIEQSGVDTVRDFRRCLVWESDRNFYDGFKMFWKIQAKDEEPQIIELSGWRTFWRAERSWGPVIWNRLPESTRPVSGVRGADYSLDDRTSDNGALRGATDGRDAGCDLSSLPQLRSYVGAAQEKLDRGAGEISRGQQRAARDERGQRR